MSRKGMYPRTSPIDKFAPCDVYASTLALTVDPTGDFSTNVKNGITSFVSRTRAPGGGAFGTGIGLLAEALAFLVFFSTTLPPLLIARRLVDPRTGSLSTNTHPTLGTGFPPSRRPSSKSHSYLP